MLTKYNAGTVYSEFIMLKCDNYCMKNSSLRKRKVQIYCMRMCTEPDKN